MNMAVCKKCNLYESLLDSDICNNCSEPVKKIYKPSWLEESDDFTKNEENNNTTKRKNFKRKKTEKENKKIKINKGIIKYFIIVLFFIIFSIFAFISYNKYIKVEPINEGILVDVTQKKSNSFGFGAKLNRSSSGVRYSDTDLETSFFVGCENNIDKLTGKAFTISIITADKAESVLITSGENLKDCLNKKEAFISDGVSVLKVIITANDSDKSVALLLASATLEKLAYNLSESQLKDVKYSILDNKLVAITDDNISNLPEGSPVLNESGESKGIIINRKVLFIRELCSILFSC